MEEFVKGDIVVVPFPFSDLSDSKKRPAMIVCSLKGNDLILCQITSKKTKDDYSVLLLEKDFFNGSLEQDSNIRPNKLFTADKSIILYKVGKLKEIKTVEVIEKICEIIKNKKIRGPKNPKKTDCNFSSA